MISDYDLMRLSESADGEGFSHEDAEEMKTPDGKITSGDVTVKINKKKTDDKAKYLKDKQKYFDYYDDIKLTPKDDW